MAKYVSKKAFLTALKRKLATMQADLSSAEGRLERAEANVERTQGRVGQTELSATAEVINALTPQVTELELQIEKTEAKYAALRTAKPSKLIRLKALRRKLLEVLPTLPKDDLLQIEFFERMKAYWQRVCHEISEYEIQIAAENMPAHKQFASGTRRYSVI